MLKMFKSRNGALEVKDSRKVGYAIILRDKEIMANLTLVLVASPLG